MPWWGNLEGGAGRFAKINSPHLLIILRISHHKYESLKLIRQFKVWSSKTSIYVFLNLLLTNYSAVWNLNPRGFSTVDYMLMWSSTNWILIMRKQWKDRFLVFSSIEKCWFEWNSPLWQPKNGLQTLLLLILRKGGYKIRHHIFYLDCNILAVGYKIK